MPKICELSKHENILWCVCVWSAHVPTPGTKSLTCQAFFNLIFQSTHVAWEELFVQQHRKQSFHNAWLLVSMKKVLDISADGWWKYYNAYWMINRRQIYFMHIIIESANSIYDMSRKYIHSLFWDKLYLAANPKYRFSLHRFLFAILAIHSFQTLRTQPYKSEQVQLSSYYK